MLWVWTYQGSRAGAQQYRSGLVSCVCRACEGFIRNPHVARVQFHLGILKSLALPSRISTDSHVHPESDLVMMHMYVISWGVV